MKKHYLTFEKSLKDLDLDIENLISLDSESDKLNQLRIEREEKEKEIFSDLSAWQTVQLARHPNRPYTLDYIHAWCDDFIELHGDKAFADDHAVVAGIGTIGTHRVVIIGQQKGRNTKENLFRNFGMMKPEGYRKALRVMKIAEKFHLPIVTLVDTPGYMPGSNQEHNGIIRHGSKLLYAYCEATVPRITLVIGKAYGGAYIAMGSKNLRTDVNYAWPTARCAVLGGEAAVKIMNRKDLAASDDPESLKKQLVDEFAEKFENPCVAASHGTVDNVINPAETRPMLIKALEMLANKREKQLPRKHGNINL